ncbi:MAG: PepSY-associated TM helix domain-containing protein [Acidobacteriota bacterium]
MATVLFMATANGWLRRPQNVWLRRALFQIHLWTGIALGLYVLVISISGSAIVFRNEIYKVADDGPKIVPVRGEKLSEAALMAKAKAAHPGDGVSFIWPSKEPNQATEIWLDHNGERVQRLFDPYTGEDLGPSVPYAIQVTAWFMRLHTDLLAGKTGRTINGIAAILFTALCITGAVVWWPGVEKWKRSLWINPKSGWKRINWDLHSAVGFWSFGLVFMWALTGIFVVWPVPVQKMVNHFSPLIQYALPEEEPSAAVAAPLAVTAQVTPAPPRQFNFGPGKGKFRRPEPRRSAGDQFLRWLYWLHFGNFAGNKTKALWVALGLIPAMLFVTGTIMWWNRVLSPAARRAARSTGDQRRDDPGRDQLERAATAASTES